MAATTTPPLLLHGSRRAFSPGLLDKDKGGEPDDESTYPAFSFVFDAFDGLAAALQQQQQQQQGGLLPAAAGPIAGRMAGVRRVLGERWANFSALAHPAASVVPCSGWRGAAIVRAASDTLRAAELHLLREREHCACDERAG